jgi:hypothetical protein
MRARLTAASFRQNAAAALIKIKVASDGIALTLRLAKAPLAGCRRFAYPINDVNDVNS